MKKNNNVYKPRYKIAFQAKSKVWAYKNSRLRHFYSIRGRRLYRDGFFRKNVLASTTLKWTVARRFIKPYSYTVRGPRAKGYYKHTLYLKQQLRHFYGKLTEVAFRSIYKTHLLNTWNRNKSFFGSLEQRADMFLYRMRVLPTIYACNQFVHHQGLLINRSRFETSPSALISIGSSVSLPKMYWKAMASYMLYRIYYRVFGKFTLKKRVKSAVKNKILALSYAEKSAVWKKKQVIRYNKNIKYKAKKKKKQQNWHIFLEGVHMIFQFGNILRAIGRARNNYHISKIEKFTYALRIESIFIELFAFSKTIAPIVNKFIPDYLLFFKLVMSCYKIKNSYTPRLSILLKLKSYLLVREFQRASMFMIEKYTLLEALIGLDLIDNMSYDRIIKRYNISIKNIFDKDKVSLEELVDYMKNKWTQIINEVPILLEDRFALIEKMRKKYFIVYYRSLFKKFKKRWRYRYDPLRKKEVFKPSSLTYYLVSRKYKQRRKEEIFKLKKVHWYIPKYIHFDVRTLRAILLYSPRTNEIVFPFNCSVSKIFSFYKSLGV